MPIYIANSYGFTIIASALYLIVTTNLWLSSWPWWLNLTLTGFLLLDLITVIGLYGMRNRKNAVTMVLPDCGKWRYQLVSGREHKGKLLRQKCFRSRFCLILYLKSLHNGRYILIPRDSMSEAHYRYLALQLFSG
jgi:hypothetical protein